ncbi:LCP family protein, partial [Anaerostipes hadrus]|uniref:LCP family protein n=1 Tax=Anaerostipes hadrus TaxID=649756 RepID=UPI001D08CA1F
IMRDIYAEILGYRNYKINTAYYLGNLKNQKKGVELLRQTLKTNFDIDVQYYALVDFQGFVKIVDTLAPQGIEMNVEHKMSENIGLTLY